uniref:NAD-dependent protein deacylase n=1 Tax=Ascaris suum TaxID=6253 RepID=F1L8U6_ASCSU
MSLLRFVPECSQPSKDVLKKFRDVLASVSRFTVLTGAGISTESGIPDYRSEKVGQYARSKHRPIDYQTFMKSERWRRRYWARNAIAWPRFSRSEPNTTHHAIASWEQSDKFNWLITQNIDGLHTKAGSRMLTELHGCGHRVRCMNCRAVFPRDEVQKWIMDANRSWYVSEVGEMAPDGDIPIPEDAIDSFTLPCCPHCGPGSILKTDVVFFGDCVPREDVDKCYEKLEESDALLVLGSSLMVMSGFRFVQRAHVRRMPILIVNIGPTRADHLATVKVSAKCTDIIKYI